MQRSTEQSDGRDGDETTIYSVTFADDGVRLSEHRRGNAPADSGADATVRGSASAWVRALGPRPELDGLQLSGRQELTSLMLQTLSPVEVRTASAVESAAS